MSDTQLKKQMADMLNRLIANKDVIDEIKKDNKMIIELLETVYQRVEDMSKKSDEILNAGSKIPKTPQTKTKSAKDVPKKKVAKKSDEKKTAPEKTKPPVNNIMGYFKHQYVEDPTIFEDILEENQAKSAIKEKKDEIDSKKEGSVRDKHSATVVYKSLTTDQRKKLRVKMEEVAEAELASTEIEVEIEAEDA